MQLHIGRSDIAHQVAWVLWINGLTLPVPTCHQGWSGPGVRGAEDVERFLAERAQYR